MFCDFDEVFHPELKWKDKKLTDNCPCKDCDTYKDYEQEALYGTIAERQYAELPDGCKICIKRLNWEIDCMQKLKWYEDNDKSLTKRGGQ